MKKLILSALIGILVLSCETSADSVDSTTAKVNQDSLAKIQATQDSVQQVELTEKIKADYQKSIALRKKYIGFKYLYPESADFIKENGSPVTLDGTDNNKWIAYFPKGDFTVVSNKKTDQFENIYPGRFPDLKSDITGPLSQLIGKKMEYDKYVEIVSSIRYGSPEQLNTGICINKDCTEFYPKGNFTTVAFMEFNDNGNFVTLKKISMGKIPDLNDL
ncbi:MAG: hypothetical protein R2824_06065 [Saprospiraceae bacterium]|nr:hypothetical protein [Lewinella sp.]